MLKVWLFAWWRAIPSTVWLLWGRWHADGICWLNVGCSYLQSVCLSKYTNVRVHSVHFQLP